MATQHELEHYEATEAQDLIRLLHALRPPERAVQVPTQVDINDTGEIWKAQVLRQVITLLSMARLGTRPGDPAGPDGQSHAGRGGARGGRVTRRPVRITPSISRQPPTT